MDKDTRWVAFTTRLFAQNQFAIKLGLDSMNRALTLSSLDTLSHRVVLVAGTNGKGTIASSMATLLSASGLKVGLYTSPHLIDFTERFRIDGKIVSREEVMDVGEVVLEQFASPASSPCLTFFELTTLMAIKVFERAGVEVAIYEVGLGGRLDATNALKPDLCVLGTVGFDHQRYLGDTLDEILDEKLGISRPHVPLFVSGQEHDAIQRRITTLPHNPLYVYNRNLGISTVFDQALSSRVAPHDSSPVLWWYAKGKRQEVALQQWGHFKAPYQRKHLVTALAAADYLSTHLMKRSSDEVIAHASASIERMQWPGRLHRVKSGDVEFLCDAAHNVDGMRALLAHTTRASYLPDVILFSALADKEVLPMWHMLIDTLPGGADILLIELDNPRAMSAEQLRSSFESTQTREGRIEVCKTEQALDLCRQWGAERGALDVLVCGSIYLLGELFERLDIDVHTLNARGA